MTVMLVASGTLEEGLANWRDGDSLHGCRDRHSGRMRRGGGWAAAKRRQTEEDSDEAMRCQYQLRRALCDNGQEVAEGGCVDAAAAGTGARDACEPGDVSTAVQRCNALRKRGGPGRGKRDGDEAVVGGGNGTRDKGEGEMGGWSVCRRG